MHSTLLRDVNRCNNPKNIKSKLTYKTHKLITYKMKIMKKILIALFITAFAVSMNAQDRDDKDYYYYNGIENNKLYNITPAQKQQIIQIKKGIGRRYAEIGRDRSLSGYQKGQKKRELSLQIRKEIYEILNSDQRINWDKNHPSNSKTSFKDYNTNVDNIEREIDAIDKRIDQMEDDYERRIDAVEDDYSLSKADRKYKKQALKDEMKAKKREMKAERQKLKDSRFYQN